MTDNIPPEIADYVKCPEIGCDLMRRPAPAPVRISPEVRETILQALDELKDKYHEVEIDDAIAFVEAL